MPDTTELTRRHLLLRPASAGPGRAEADGAHLRCGPRGASNGQIIVVLVLLLVGPMRWLGLAVDLGFAFAARRAVQGAADAVALAPARRERLDA